MSTAFSPVVRLRRQLRALRERGEAARDERERVDTTGWVSLHAHGGENLAYVAVPWSGFDKLPPGWSLGPDDVVLDLGCGKGRGLLLAGRHGAGRAIGVDFAPELCEIARQNARQFEYGRYADRIEVVSADVREYTVPDDVSVVFLYNPFTGEPFARALEHVLASQDRRPRRLRMIYRNPLEHRHLMATGRTRLRGARLGLRPSPSWSLSRSTFFYEVLPADRTHLPHRLPRLIGVEA